MKRSHGSGDSGSEDNDDAFDDGDDLMARAAEMMEFDDDDEEEDDSEGSQEDSEKQEEVVSDLDGEEQAQQQPARKKQKASNGTAHSADEPVAEGDEVVTSSVLQLQVSQVTPFFPRGVDNRLELRVFRDYSASAPCPIAGRRSPRVCTGPVAHRHEGQASGDPA